MICSHQSFSKEARFEDLVESVQHCDLCSRLCAGRKILSPANGNLHSRVLFVAEAPGRLGAAKTGIPLYGDRTGDNFGALLGNIGWNREDVFITNAVLCNPKHENGNNAPPTREEVDNCSAYLEMVVTLISPDVIVPLGTTALNALGILAPHGIALRASVARLIPWRTIGLFPMYHPGPRAILHRSLARQRADFMLLAKVVHPITGLTNRRKRRSKIIASLPTQISTAQHIARLLLDLGGRMAYFKMTKLMYLIDLTSLRTRGYTIANSIYLRQVDGPWPPQLNSALEALQGYEVYRYFVGKAPMIAPGPSPRFEIQLDAETLDIVRGVFGHYGSKSNAELKQAVYCTDLMKHVLREESSGAKMINRPIIYENKTILDAKGKL